MNVEVRTPEEMEGLGRRLAALLRPGDILLLNGSLGAGKTLLVSGIAQALGVEVQVTSPTFLVVRTYDEGLLPLAHVDVYRLSSTAEFTDLEVVQDTRDGVLAIEWGDAVRTALPEDLLSIDLRADEDGVRTVTFSGEGQWEQRSLQELAS
ncbi:MAG: tRNA (adenosine(37)-N6)-threonylcarbamoyltransferase complex ATPase subunit type 1 TsaE [Acidimicrobiia bacterium]|nr:tRNA (adenosine(37)-N6)-threonylcarbamoyltransferase complex ATPase subunit type 1 TsaE [Acidimicrobiia bacterium]